MPDLDQLLVDDASSDKSPTVPALAPAVERARSTTRRRHVMFGTGAAAVAIALCGGLAYVGAGGLTNSSGRQTTKLAAYDHVIGADPTHPGNRLVIGPADEHTSNCEKAPDPTVVVGKSRVKDINGKEGDGIAFIFHMPPGAGAGAGPIQLPKDDGTNGPYYLFSCPSS